MLGIVKMFILNCYNTTDLTTVKVCVKKQTLFKFKSVESTCGYVRMPKAQKMWGPIHDHSIYPPLNESNFESRTFD